MPLSAPIAVRINAERLALAGWCRAILLQMAHPLVASGVAAHSSFRGSAFGPAHRLRSTVRAMLALTFGTQDVRARAIEGIRSIHRHVQGRLPAAVGPFPAGTPYSAEDPALVLWVHATLVESVVLTHELLVQTLTGSEKDAYCADSAWAAVALGAREREVPKTWAALEAYMAGEYASGRIVVGDQGRAIAGAVLGPPLGRLIWPAVWLNRTLTLGLLPADIRWQYRYDWTERQARRFRQVAGVIRRSRSVLPPLLALWPEARRMPIR